VRLKLTLLSMLLVMISASAIWKLAFRPWTPLSNDPEVAAAQRLGHQLADDDDDRGADAKADRLVERIEALDDGQQVDFLLGASASFSDLVEAERREFFELSPEAQLRKLDEHIDRIQRARLAARKAFQQARAEGKLGTRTWTPLNSKKADQMERQSLDALSPELRGMTEQYDQMLRERMHQRGIRP